MVDGHDPDPAHEDFYTWGAAITEITDTLDRVCRALGEQGGHEGDTRVLRDDAGMDPYERLADTRYHLAALYPALEHANAAARGLPLLHRHIAMEVDPDAAEDDEP